MSYSIRGADLEREASLFLDVLGRNLRNSPHETGIDRFRWLYLDNPAGRGAAHLLSFADAQGESRIVGCTGLGMRRFASGSRTFRAALAADFAVDEQHRSLLPALRLQRNAHEWAATAADLSYGFPNIRAIGVFRRLGYHEGSVSRYVRVLRHEAYVARVVPIQAAAALGGAILDGALNVRDRWRRRQTGSRLRLEWVPDADERFDRLFEEARGSYRLLGERGAAFVRWRLARVAEGRTELAALFDADGTLRAYASVVATEPGVAFIDDFLGATPADFGLLLEPFLRDLRARGFRSVSLEFAGDPRIKDVLAAHTFLPRESCAVVFSPGVGFAGDLALLKDSSAWYLNGADRDT